jgi:hypothetical protein
LASTSQQNVPGYPPTDSSGVAFKDAKELWTNYKGYKHLGLAGPTRDYACPAHLIWFPQINKTDSNVFQLRTSFFMTTSLTCRFYSKFPSYEDTAYSALEAYMGQLYISDNDTGSKLAKGVSDTHGKFSLVLLTLVVLLDLRISLRIF